MAALNDIARYVNSLNFEELPAEVVEATRLPLIDCVGVIIAGLEDDSSKITAEWVESSAGISTATIIYGFKKAAPAWAALANGTAAHALDFDDVNFRMMGHPSVALVPAILAVGESESLSGKECILAYVIGLEVAAKIGQALGGNPYTIGWHQTSTMGTLGAAASCGKLLGLSEEELVNALGVSCSMASGIRANFGTMTKPFHAGMAAMNGVMAAQLAQRGFTANPESLFGENGFARTFSADLDKEDTVTATLGNPYELIDPGLSFKPYPCCRGPQGAIDAALIARAKLVEKEGEVDPARIERLECRVPSWLRGVLMYHTPQTGTEGKFSLEFCVSAALTDGKVGVGQFRDEKVTAKEITTLIDRFDWQDLEGDVTSPFAARIGLTLVDGSEITSAVEKPLGEPGNPMSEEQIYDKYLECVKDHLGENAAQKSLGALRNLEETRDVSNVIELLREG